MNWIIVRLISVWDLKGQLCFRGLSCWSSSLSISQYCSYIAMHSNCIVALQLTNVLHSLYSYGWPSVVSLLFSRVIDLPISKRDENRFLLWWKSHDVNEISLRAISLSRGDRWGTSLLCQFRYRLFFWLSVSSGRATFFSSNELYKYQTWIEKVDHFNQILTA